MRIISPSERYCVLTLLPHYASELASVFPDTSSLVLSPLFLPKECAVLRLSGLVHHATLALRCIISIPIIIVHALHDCSLARERLLVTLRFVIFMYSYAVLLPSVPLRHRNAHTDPGVM